MAPSTDLWKGGFWSRLAAPGRFTDSLRNRHQIFISWHRFRGRSCKPENFPANRGSQSLTVGCAKVVTVRLRVGGEWAKYRGRLGIHVRQRRFCHAITGGARTATNSHRWDAIAVATYRGIPTPTSDSGAVNLPPTVIGCIGDVVTPLLVLNRREANTAPPAGLNRIAVTPAVDFLGVQETTSSAGIGSVEVTGVAPSRAEVISTLVAECE
ncbi:hypothetical protein GALL_379680 [mine drainage metagenome]|uniref:Uncharacterized protein n=1 Tax=mine drainage metagenome TaxID=410659 RepID=A0A1J5QAQ7_9ZZZZ